MRRLGIDERHEKRLVVCIYRPLVDLVIAASLGHY